MTTSTSATATIGSVEPCKSERTFQQFYRFRLATGCVNFYRETIYGHIAQRQFGYRQHIRLIVDNENIPFIKTWCLLKVEYGYYKYTCSLPQGTSVLHADKIHQRIITCRYYFGDLRLVMIDGSFMPCPVHTTTTFCLSLQTSRQLILPTSRPAPQQTPAPPIPLRLPKSSAWTIFVHPKQR